jgi:S1-C subfamily serine protease
MRTFVIFLLTSLSTVSAAQKAAVQHRTQVPIMSTRQLHNSAVSSTVAVVAGPNTATESLGSGVWVSKDGYLATCWHVVENASEVQVKVAYPGVYDLEKNMLVNAVFAVYAATVAATDKKADVAILKVSPNPFVTPPAIQRMVNGEPEIKLASADLRTGLPNPGDLALLAGYPLGRPDLLTQRGAVAAVALVWDFQGVEASKGVRIILSLVSNPANSGGPVFDSDGKVLGLLQGNFPSPVKDEAQRQALYVRPKRDANGNFELDANGEKQFETAPMKQNSGISVVVPARFVQNALDQAQGKAPVAQAKGSVVIRDVEVINAPPDTESKVASALSPGELKQQVASFLVTFRSFLSQQEQRQRQLGESAVPALPKTTREEREAAWVKLGDESIALQKDMRQQYHARFKTEAKQLRDDLWARLPVDARDTRSVRLYDYGLDLVELRHIADDLERLSKMLPE